MLHLAIAISFDNPQRNNYIKRRVYSRFHGGIKLKRMNYCNTSWTYWHRGFLSLLLVSIFHQALSAESCGQIGPDSNYSKLNEILKCLEDKIDKGSSAKGSIGQSNSTEAKKTTIKTSSEKLPVFRATGSSVISGNDAQRVRDGLTHTGWQARSNGAWVELQLDRACVVEEIFYYLIPKRYAQLRQVSLKFDDNSTQNVRFEHSEKEGWQHRPLTPTKAEKVRIIVEDVFPEANPDYLWIAEIELHGNQCDK